MMKYPSFYKYPATAINPMGYYVAECETVITRGDQKTLCGGRFTASSKNPGGAWCPFCGRKR